MTSIASSRLATEYASVPLLVIAILPRSCCPARSSPNTQTPTRVPLIDGAGTVAGGPSVTLTTGSAKVPSVDDSGTVACDTSRSSTHLR
jgi:hypothetical protein